MDEQFQDGAWFTEWDELLYGDPSNKQSLLELSRDFQLTSEIVDDNLPELDGVVLPHASKADVSLMGRKKRRALRRRARRAREDGPEVDLDDFHYSEYKYQQFYKGLQKERETWVYESPLKRFLDGGGVPTLQSEKGELGNLPRTSVISVGKQRLYLRLQNKFHKTPDVEDPKYRLYLFLKKVVQKEQKDYMSFCLKQAKYTKQIDYESMLPNLITYIERTLFHRQHSTPGEYDALYHLNSVLQMHKVCKAEYAFEAIQSIHAQGTVPLANTTGDFVQGLQLEDVADDLEFLYPSNDRLGHLHKATEQACYIYKMPISKDPNALQFALDHDAEVVTSSSVMQLLIDVHPYSLQNSATRRDIPVLVKMVEMPHGAEQKVVLMDKALPPLEMNIFDKKMWAVKKAIKVSLASYDVKTYNFSEMVEVDESNTSKATPNAKVSAAATATDPAAKDLVSSASGRWEVEAFEEEEEDFPVAPPSNHNVTYGLYRLCEKDGGRKINLVVRSSYHAYEPRSESERPKFLHFSVKLEHQPEYGAQCTTISEISREWMALSLRKGATLCRVRVDAKTLEVVQVEKKTIKSLARECKQRGMNVESRIASLHHVFSELTSLEPGSYILQLIPIEGVARLLEHETTHTNLRGGSYYNLHLHFRRANHLIGPQSHVPYSAIDPTVATPYHKKNNRIPATFNPRGSEQPGADQDQMLSSHPSMETLDQIAAEDFEMFEGEEEMVEEMSSPEKKGDESFVEDWLEKIELAACAKYLESSLEESFKEQSVEEPKVAEEQKAPEQEVPVDEDLVKILRDVQVRSPLSMMEPSVLEGDDGHAQGN